MEIMFIYADGWEETARSEPVRVAVYRDADSPADGLELEFAGAQPHRREIPCGVRMENAGALLFEGIVDTHTAETERGAGTETFVCRSLAARLLDNEARPGILNRPSARVMEKLYLEPFGLRLGGEDTGPAAGRISVERGTRCWTVLCRFAERFLHTGVYCTRSGEVFFGKRPRREIVLPEILRVRVTRSPYARISRAVVQNARTGAFNTVYENPAAAGVQRVRYFSSADMSVPGREMAAGEQAAFGAEVACAGFLEAEPGDGVRLPGMEDDQLEVTGVRYVRTADREETVLSLVRCTDGKENGYVEF